MRLTFSIAAILLAAVGLAFEFGCVAICDGSYDLSVTVKSLSRSPIRAVSCEGMRNVGEARSRLADLPPLEMLDHLPPPETSRWSASVEPFTGRPLIVAIPLSFRESPLGRTWGDFQLRGLLVIVQYQNGERKGKAVEIPHRHESRSVTVEFP
ncbi:MAG TPA: hypothetical protein VMF69_20425 [Gemmataceae bacterium]|nr:hypothetical protein [Gemmataceae bacterium]